jgi:hypothetical protein
MPQGQQLGGVTLDRWFEKAIQHVISGSPEIIKGARVVSQKVVTENVVLAESFWRDQFHACGLSKFLDFVERPEDSAESILKRVVERAREIAV